MSEKNFGRNLEKLIDDLGMYQGEFAKKVGITPAAVSQLIDGKRQPSVRTVLRIMKLTSISFEKLFK